jgi:hypothetical protein
MGNEPRVHTAHNFYSQAMPITASGAGGLQTRNGCHLSHRCYRRRNYCVSPRWSCFRKKRATRCWTHRSNYRKISH